ncbi:MAG: RNA-binding protein [Halodesulfurarchaeum sp.]
MGLPVHYVDLRAFCYATESEDRVREALRTVLPEDAEIDVSTGEGHHGDPIRILSARIETADRIEAIFDRLSSGLEFSSIRDELEQRLDDNNAVYLTLEKQKAARGTVAQGDGITLRAKIEAYPASRDRALENAREAFS